MQKDGYTYLDGLLLNKDGNEAGSIVNGGYVSVYVNNGVNRKMAHKIIWEMFNGTIPEGMELDHINGNPADNRIENLQLLSHHQNTLRKNKSKGYSKKKNLTRPYQATKKHNYKQHFLGYFGTKCGAYMANRMFFIGT